jgi:hypothetical protein
MTAAGGLGVAALAGLAFALSYDDLRLLALAGGAMRRFAPLYPAMVDTLVVVTIVSLVVARHTRWWARAIRWLLLFVLLAGGAAAGTQRALKGYAPLPDTWLSAGVAVAPWLLLFIAVWLWLSMFKQVKAISAAQPTTPPDEHAAWPAPSPAVRPEPEAESERPAGAGPVPMPVAGNRESEAAPVGGPSPESIRTPVTVGLARQPMRAESSLPTDIKLVTRPSGATETTQPDLVLPVRENADDAYGTDGEPTPDSDPPSESDAGGRPETDAAAADPASAPGGPDKDEDDDVERWSALAAEDAERWAEEAAGGFGDEASRPGNAPGMEWPPPASKFRSSPTPPRD